MLVIGLTGGIGSGKTTVSNLFAKHNVPIIDADIIARDITKPGNEAYNKIIAHFGNAVIKPDGYLDRAGLRRIIFADDSERKWLEGLLHPIIRKRIADEIKKLHAPYSIVVIPLLHEVTPYPFINRILVVDTDEGTQIKRVIARDNTSEQQVRSILRTQLKREERRLKSDDVIINDGHIGELSAKVAKLHKFYLKLSKNK